MKRTLSLMLTLMLVVLSLTACSALQGGKEPSSTPAVRSAAPSGKSEEKVVRGIINRMDNFLVLLTEDDEYQTMDYGEGVTTDGFAEGDRVEITYTGELGENSTPVIVRMTKVD